MNASAYLRQLAMQRRDIERLEREVRNLRGELEDMTKERDDLMRKLNEARDYVTEDYWDSGRKGRVS